jgi:3-deoxy-D-manno-octulosonic-acid transferase
MFKRLGYFWYVISTQAYFLLVKIVAPINQRARKLVLGQKALLSHIKQSEASKSSNNIWFHVSSLGEFEQGRPLMEALKAKLPNHRIVVTFFSPSGYEAKINDPIADAVYYLPFESKNNAQELINILQPKMAFWVKYDFWYQYLIELKNKQIPVFLIAAQFRLNQIFFNPLASFHASILHLFNFIFCQTHLSEELLSKIGQTNHLFTGDNRYDRVIQNTQNIEEIAFITNFQNNETTLIVGSSYQTEEQMIQYAIQQQTPAFKCIIAPHFVDEDRIKEIEKLFGKQAIRYSQINKESNLSSYKILIIDCIGLLSRLYKYGHLAFVGGGFWENGLHNSLEPAAFGMPLSFGPKLRRFPEAQDLVELGFAKTIHNKEEFHQWLVQHLNNPSNRLTISQNCREFVQSNKGATQKVMEKIHNLNFFQTIV